MNTTAMKRPSSSSAATLTCILLTGLLASHSFSAPPSTPPTEPKWDALVTKKLKLPPPPENSIICIGSSHMALWKTMEADLAPLKVFNMGIGGSRMKHAADLFVPKLVIPFKPRAILLYEGSNDLANGSLPEEVLQDFQRLYEQLHAALPASRLYVLGIVPSPGKRFERWDAIQETNKLLQDECQKHSWMRFIDTTSPLLDAKGKPRPECFIPNDIHMTEAGYDTWKAAVAPVLLSVEGSSEPVRP